MIDPILSVASGASRIRASDASTTRFALSPGGGIRIPILNRFQLRADVRDAIVFNSRTGPGGAERTAHNLEIQAALGITF